MATGKALNGKPYAGNPHVRFDEGEVAPAATPRRGSLLYKIMFLAMAIFGEAGNDREAKGSCIESASNRSAGAESLRKKRMTDEEIAAIAAKHRMAKFPNLALTRESRQVAPADALRPLPPRVGGREKGKVRNAETELTGEKKSYNIRIAIQER